MPDPSAAINVIMTEITHLKESIDKLEKYLEKRDEKIDKLISELDSKYAAKWTEKIWTYVLTAVGGAFLAGLIAMVINTK